jgi:hypothetical protein
VVRKGGIDLNINHVDGAHPFFSAYSPGHYGSGQTIIEAVDNALSKLRAAESVEASIQGGEKE